MEVKTSTIVRIKHLVPSEDLSVSSDDNLSCDVNAVVFRQLREIFDSSIVHID